MYYPCEEVRELREVVVIDLAFPLWLAPPARLGGFVMNQEVAGEGAGRCVSNGVVLADTGRSFQVWEDVEGFVASVAGN